MTKREKNTIKFKEISHLIEFCNLIQVKKYVVLCVLWLIII